MKQENISAGDKDFPVEMDKHLSLACLELCQLMADIDGTEPMDTAEY